MKRAVYAGSFDPITLGHLDVIQSASKDFDELLVALMVNPNKPVLRKELRLKWVEKTIYQAGLTNVRVLSYFEAPHSLTVDVAKWFGAKTLIRGIRGVTDMEEEKNLAFNNAKLAPDIHTIWYPVTQENYHVSSSVVRFLLGNCRDLDTKLKHYLPESIIYDVIAQNKICWNTA